MKIEAFAWPYNRSQVDYGKVQFSEWAPTTQKISKYCASKVKFVRRLQLDICGDKFINFFIISLKTGENADFSPKFMIVFN